MNTASTEHCLNNVRIVLVGAQHGGNIGATARAMKVMGLTGLRLVAPERELDAEAEARASGATDVLANAQSSDTLDEAVAECRFVIGTSARPRRTAWPMDNPRSAAERLIAAAGRAPVAVVFGCERSGLDNACLDKCQRHLQIPTSPDYGSLNLAAAVQVVAYELRMATLGAAGEAQSRPRPIASHAEMEGFFAHLEAALREAGFFKPTSGGLMRRVRRLFNRAAPDTREINLLRGGLKALSGGRSGRQ